MKKRPCTPWFVFRLLQQFDNFFWTEWPGDHKNRCLSSSTNSVGLHFHEGVEKIKENDKNTNFKNRKPTKWVGKVWRVKPRARGKN